MANSRNRDFKAEYARRQERAKQAGFSSYYKQRVTRGIAKGYTRSQAAGTPGKAELPVSIKNVPDTKRNWIANQIKEIHSELQGTNRREEPERFEAYEKIVKDYQQWRKSGWNDKTRHEVNNDIRDYFEYYEDDFDYAGGEGETPVT